MTKPRYRVRSHARESDEVVYTDFAVSGPRVDEVQEMDRLAAIMEDALNSQDNKTTREVILRIRTNWPPERIAAVLIGDKKTNVSRAELIEVKEAPPHFTSSRGDY